MPRLMTLIFLLLIVLCWNAAAQDDDSIVISVQLEQGMEYLDNSTLISDFEAAHPGVRVNMIYKPFRIEDYIPQPYPYNDLEAHFAAVDAFTLQADVLLMSVGEGISQLSLEATRAGYVLDLAPLFNADRSADASVYYPTVWQTAQWDGGLWILPTSTLILAVVYEADAFDAAGIAYPNANWRAEDFANAADVLAVRDAAGDVKKPGFFGSNWSEGALVYRFLKQPLYDTAGLSAAPQFLRADTLALAEVWLPSLETGAMFNFQHDYGDDFSPFPSPLTTDRLSIAYLNDHEVAPLPGGGALVNINGLVVSGRTHYPELAYELASYLAADSRVASALSMSWGGMTLARPAYGAADAIEHAPYSLMTPTAEARQIMDDALTSGIPASELMYYLYFKGALEETGANQKDIETAFRDAEILAMDNLARAAEKRSAMAGEIPTPAPEIALAPGEIELHFYHQEGDSLRWQAFAREFADQDAEVARVNMESSPYRFDYTREGTDCFYFDGSLAQTASEHLLDLAPLLAADASFDVDDWLTGTLAADQPVYALPLTIRPLALWYDPAQLATANLLPPQTISDLADVFSTWQTNDPARLSSYHLDTTLLMLMAAYGAVPVQARNGAIDIDSTSENNAAVIRQVLDLARSGVIKYAPMTDPLSSVFPDDELFVADIVADSMFRQANYLPVVFPPGSAFTPVSYSLMAGYISRYSQHPEACYRLLRALSQRPDLVSGIPAQRSAAATSVYAVFYEAFNQQLMDDNLVVIPSDYSESAYFTRFWLLRAFDRYVLDGANLDRELADAEMFTRDYLTCIDSGDRPRDCALEIDPTVADHFILKRE